jgi:hypothetical protein
VCDAAPTIEPFASISNIRAIGHAGSASEHRGQLRNRRTALQSVAVALAILCRESSFEFTLSKETHIMDAISRTALVIAIVAAAMLLLLFGGGMATGTMMSGGIMGSWSTGEIIWMWLPTLFVVVLGVVFFSTIPGRK